MSQSVQSTPVFAEIQQMLAPYIKPKEEVTRIRKLLAVHFCQQFQNRSIIGPLALQHSSLDASASLEGLTKLQREYFESLRANSDAREQYEELRKDVQAQTNEKSWGSHVKPTQEATAGCKPS